MTRTDAAIIGLALALLGWTVLMVIVLAVVAS